MAKNKKTKLTGGRIRFAKPTKPPKSDKAMDNFIANGGGKKRR